MVCAPAMIFYHSSMSLISNYQYLPSDFLGMPPMMPQPTMPSTQPGIPPFNPIVNQQPSFEPVPPPVAAPLAAPPTAPPTVFNPAEAMPTVPTGAPPAALPPNAAARESTPPAAALPHVPSYQSSAPANHGWNDPPSGAKRPSQPSNLRKLKPTKPTATSMELPTGMLNPAAYVPSAQPQHPAPGFAAGPPMVPGAPTAWMNPNNSIPVAAASNGVAHPPPSAPAVAAPAAPAAAPPAAAPVVKKPIPAEHQMLYDTFADALTRCQGATKNPVMKRKLDDVGKKMEILAEKLREGGVSANVLAGLHQMASAVGGKDYQTGLKVYALIVRGGNFAEISSFMPGLKTLMQSATQLRV